MPQQRRYYSGACGLFLSCVVLSGVCASETVEVSNWPRLLSGLFSCENPSWRLRNRVEIRAKLQRDRYRHRRIARDRLDRRARLVRRKENFGYAAIGVTRRGEIRTIRIAGDLEAVRARSWRGPTILRPV
jgi:hypothetical protein